MSKNMSKLEKLSYDVKYTAGAYLDASLSLPIVVSEKLGDLSKKIFKEKNSSFLSNEVIRANSPVYQFRERLREELDTKPGASYLQSNLVAVLPFFLVGMPAAELAEKGINHWAKDIPEVAKYAINSAITLTTQMIFGYTTFMANEVRTNQHKYKKENGKFSPKKITSGLFNSIKAFLSFDIPFSVGKVGGQSLFLYQGKDPWIASGLFDSISFPAWYSIAIPLGLHKGLIETKQTEYWKKLEQTN